MPLNMQAKLLRVIQDGDVTPVGGDDPFTVNVRIIAATNRNLEKPVKEGGFRDDLYYRLNVVPIGIPPLRERREDIPLLVEHIIDKLNRKLNKNVERLPDGLMQALYRYSFPGNVRELENMLERGFILSEGNRIDPGAFPMLEENRTGEHPGPRNLKSVSRNARRNAEREAITDALNRTNWNRVRAARMLGVDYKTLRNKIKELNIEPVYLPEGGNDE
jgi:DNA-binding NtrC family response regulator